MRPILVLLLVLAAAGGFFFVLTKDKPGKGGTTGPIVGPSAPAEAPRTETPNATTLGEVPQSNVGRDVVTPTVPRVEEPPKIVAKFDTGSGTVVGSVVDQNGVGIADAEVRLTHYGAESLFFLDVTSERIPDITTKSVAGGKFRFEDVPAYDQYSLVATHSKFSRAERFPIIVADGKVTEEPNVVLEPGVGLSGKITDTGGNNVGGASVRLTLTSIASLLDASTDSVEVKSDGEGRYAFQNLAAGNYSLTVIADGYGRVDIANLNIAGKEAATKDIVVEVAHMIAGSVRSVDGQPLAEVEVQAWSMDNRNNQSRSSVKSDEQGQFVIQDVPQGQYRLIAQHPAYEMSDRNLRAETGDMSLQILMRALPRVRGQVVSAASGQPITAFTVQLRQPIPNSNSTSAVPTTRISVVDPEGRFDLGAPRAGEYRVHVVAGSHADTLSAPFTVNLGTDFDGVIVRMIAGGTLRGRVVDSTGAPVSGARVSSHHKDWADDLFTASLGDLQPWLATEASAVTDGEGRYELENLMPESYQVIVKHPDYAGATQSNLVVTDGSETLVREIVLPAGSTVSGVVYGPNGSPLGGALVKLIAEGQFGGSVPGGPYQARSDEQGRYSITNVKQGSYGAYATRPRGASAGPFQEPVDMRLTKRTLTIREGSNYDGEDFKLRDQ